MDHLLRDAGEQWRRDHTAPLAAPPFDTNPIADRPAVVRRLAPLAAIPAVIAIVLVVVLVVHPAGPAPSQSNGGPTPSTTPSTTPQPVATCTGEQLPASVVTMGAAGGTEHIWIALENTSTTPCRLGGFLSLTGVRSNGTTARLPIATSSAPGVAGAVRGPGTVAPGGYGAFGIAMGLNCTPNIGKYAELRIGLGSGEYVEIPYPSELSLGCADYETEAGPIPSLAALNSQ